MSRVAQSLLDQLLRDKLNPYSELGLSPDATERAIKKAWRATALRLHPDRNPDDTAAEEAFKRAALAYQILSDEQLRAAYDLEQALTGKGRPTKPRTRRRRPQRPSTPHVLSERMLLSLYIKALADVVLNVTEGRRWRQRTDPSQPSEAQLRYLRSLWRKPRALSFVPLAHQDSLKRAWKHLDELDKSEASALITILVGLHAYEAWPRSANNIQPVEQSLEAQRRRGGGA